MACLFTAVQSMGLGMGTGVDDSQELQQRQFGDPHGVAGKVLEVEVAGKEGNTRVRRRGRGEGRGGERHDVGV